MPPALQWQMMLWVVSVGKLGFAAVVFFPRRAVGWMSVHPSTASIPGQFSEPSREHGAGLLIINGFLP